MRMSAVEVRNSEVDVAEFWRERGSKEARDESDPPPSTEASGCLRNPRTLCRQLGTLAATPFGRDSTREQHSSSLPPSPTSATGQASRAREPRRRALAARSRAGWRRQADLKCRRVLFWLDLACATVAVAFGPACLVLTSLSALDQLGLI
ncbi:hypothetical protein AAT19DRAFT_12014 [Rhodotorula toruloides]|uniref:Uncharacterized protein n=1 Tax=Rhodotorula toruloides TaxID=5286 RepID=A0A2T0AEZ9_RHOTO|nr:hypothetical protein AAT19DRAFT_12014 [Rhodotorula toruloides]